MDAIRETGLWLLFDVSVKSLLLAGLAAIVLRCLPKVDVNLRHRVWTAVLAAMLLLPLLMVITPSVSLPVVLWQSHEGAQAPAVKHQSHRPGVAAREPFDRSPKFDFPESPVNSEPPPAAPSADVTESASQQAATQQPIAPLPPRRERSFVQGFAAVPWTAVVGSLYLAGVFLLFVRLAFGIWATRRLRRLAVPISRPLNVRARVVSSGAVRVPVTLGGINSCIVLPADWAEWSDELLHSVLAHEQAHLDRRDHLVLWASEINRCLYWFHPLAWFLRRNLAGLAEQCCDDTVVDSLGSRALYAKHLLEIARRLTASPQRVAPLGISMARTSAVEVRIEAILDARRPLARRIGRWGALTILAIATPLVLLTAALRAADPQPSATQAPVAAPGVTPQSKKADSAAAAKSDAIVPGITVTGRAVLKADGSPVSGADVRLVTRKDSRTRPNTRQATSDESGNFQFENIPPGKHRVLAFRDDLASRTQRYLGTEIEVVADKQFEPPIVLELLPAPSIQVRVTSKTSGEPIEGAEAKLVWSDTTPKRTTDARGEALFRGLTPEVWHVEVQAPGFAEQVHPLNLAGSEMVDLPIELEPGGSIRGVIRDSAGQPLEKVRISVFPEDQGEQIEYLETDATGSYAFDYLPLDKSLKLNISRDSYLNRDQSFRLPSGGERSKQLDLELVRRPDGGSVVGSVTDPTGKPIAGAAITNSGRSSNDVRKATTDAEGRFQLNDVFEGSIGHTLVVRAPHFAAERINFEPGTAAAPTKIAVQLSPGRRIRGRVQDPAGNPIAGARAVFADGDHGFDSVGEYKSTDKDGSFEFDTVPSGASFRFSARGFSDTPDKPLPLDGSEVVTVVMQPAGVISGQVVDAKSGEAISDFIVHITFSPDREPSDPSGTLSGARVLGGERFVAADGRFLIDELVAGMPLQVGVEAKNYTRQVMRRVVAEPRPGLKLIEFPLEPIRPDELTSVRGTIVDDHDRPIAGAELRLIVAQERPAPRNRFPFNWEMIESGQVGKVAGVSQFLSVTSNSQGAFAFEGVLANRQLELAYWGEGVSEGRLDQLERRSNDERNMLRINTISPAVVRGKIDRQELPDISSVAVSSAGRIRTKWLTTADTSYEIRNIPPGSYELQVYGKRQPVGNREGGFTLPVIERQTVELKSGQTLVVDLGHEERATKPTRSSTSQAQPVLSNDIQQKAAAVEPRPDPAKPPGDTSAMDPIRIRGRVVDAEGTPIAGADVSLPLRMTGRAEEGRKLSGKSADDGRFTFDVPKAWIAPGTFTPLWTLWAYAPNHRLGTAQAYKQLFAGDTSELEIKLEPQTDTSFRVIDPDGKPVPGAIVEPWHVKTPVAYEIPPDDLRPQLSGTTDADGRAHLPAIGREGLHRIAVRAEGFGDQQLRLKESVNEPAEREVLLRAATPLAIQITGENPEHTRGLRVAVTSTADDEGPLPLTEGIVLGFTDENGLLPIPALAEGPLQVMVLVDPELPLRPQLPNAAELSGARPQSIEIPLVPATRVRGIVREKETGEGIPNVLVSVQYGGAPKGARPQSSQVRSDASGKFETYVLPGNIRQQAIMMPEGRLQLGEPWNEQHAVAAADDPVDLPPLELVKSQEIRGQVVDARGEPLADLQLNGISGNRRYGFSRTDAEGRFTIQVPPGIELRYQVWPVNNAPVDAEIVGSDPLLLKARVRGE